MLHFTNELFDVHWPHLNLKSGFFGVETQSYGTGKDKNPRLDHPLVGS